MLHFLTFGRSTLLDDDSRSFAVKCENELNFLFLEQNKSLNLQICFHSFCPVHYFPVAWMNLCHWSRTAKVNYLQLLKTEFSVKTFKSFSYSSLTPACRNVHVICIITRRKRPRELMQKYLNSSENCNVMLVVSVFTTRCCENWNQIMYKILILTKNHQYWSQLCDKNTQIQILAFCWFY